MSVKKNLLSFSTGKLCNSYKNTMAKSHQGLGMVGFDMSDIQANNAGISYGAELKERAIKGIFQ